MTGWRRWVWPLFSRKVQTAIGGLVVLYFAEANINVSDLVDKIVAAAAVVGTTASIILGIAHEDAGAKSAGKQE